MGNNIASQAAEVYRIEPLKDTKGEFGFTDFYKFGACRVTGWRREQEDRLVCLPRFFQDYSFFAVYDGHGGEEASQYLCQSLHEHLIDALKETDDKELALFLSFLTCDLSLREIKQGELSEVRNNREKCDLFYNSVGTSVPRKRELKETDLHSALSSCSTNKNNASGASGSVKKYSDKPESSCSTDKNNASGSAKEYSDKTGSSVLAIESGNMPGSSVVAEKNDNMPGSTVLAEGNDNMPGSSVIAEENDVMPGSSVISEENDNMLISSVSTKENDNMPGSSVIAEENDNMLISSVSTNENDNMPGSSVAAEENNNKPGASVSSGEIIPFRKEELFPRVKSTLKKLIAKSKTFQHLYNAEDLNDEDDVSDDEDYKMDEDMEEESESSEISSISDGGEYSDSEDSEVNESDDQSDSSIYDRLQEIVSAPLIGVSCGSTATVVFFDKKTLYVANIGDSRCIVSIKGRASQLSIDHTPELIGERRRIKEAGFRVTVDGRINHGLNMSRSFGDYGLKMEKTAEVFQAVSCEPYIKSMDITEELDFIVIASDGIWNVWDNQDVVDFIKQREEMELEDICAELFEVLMPMDITDDGTGCDNMTVIIIRFENSNILPNYSRKQSIVYEYPPKMSKDDQITEQHNKDTQTAGGKLICSKISKEFTCSKKDSSLNE